MRPMNGWDKVGISIDGDLKIVLADREAYLVLKGKLKFTKMLLSKRLLGPFDIFVFSLKFKTNRLLWDFY